VTTLTRTSLPLRIIFERRIIPSTRLNVTTINMPPRLNVINFARAIPYRPKAQAQWLPRSATRLAPTQTRTYSDAKDEDKVPAADRSKRLDAQPLLHVSEEAAQMAEITGGEGPDLSQGTPVQEIVKGDKEAEEKLPKVMQEQLKSKASSAPKGTRSYSTTTTPIGGGGGAFDMGLMSFTPPPTEAAPAAPGLKFDMPTLPLPKDGHMKHRYDPVVDQVTNLLMRHGKKSVAQRVRHHVELC
jgi:small subunit ribosomal protein S7